MISFDHALEFGIEGLSIRSNLSVQLNEGVSRTSHVPARATLYRWHELEDVRTTTVRERGAQSQQLTFRDRRY